MGTSLGERAAPALRRWSANSQGAHRDAVAALAEAHLAANRSGLSPYGGDEYSHQLDRAVTDIFGSKARGFYLPSGTAANALILSLFAGSSDLVVTPSCSHALNFESGAVEYATRGARFAAVDTYDGKISPWEVERVLVPRTSLRPEQTGIPRVLLVSELTEYGTAYRVKELSELSQCAHANGMKFVIDGARLFHAAAKMNLDLRQLTTDVGADAVSIDLSKNGGTGCLAVLLDGSYRAEDVRRRMKQLGFVQSDGFADAAQSLALLQPALWRTLASHSNQQAAELAKGFSDIGVQPVFPVEGNLVFVRLPQSVRDELMRTDAFYVWDSTHSLVRFEAGHGTNGEAVSGLIAALGQLADKRREFEQTTERLAALSPLDLKALYLHGRISDECYYASWNKLLDRLTVRELNELVRQGVITATDVGEVFLRAGVGHA